MWDSYTLSPLHSKLSLHLRLLLFRPSGVYYYSVVVSPVTQYPVPERPFPQVLPLSGGRILLEVSKILKLNSIRTDTRDILRLSHLI